MQAADGSPRARLPLLFRPHNPTRNAAASGRSEILVIMKTLPLFFLVKVFAIMKVKLLFEESGPASRPAGTAHARI